MTAQHGADLVDKVRSSVDIVSLISEFVSLKKSGRRYRGLCPFHNEKTPSFYVDETKQLFYCFGCGTGGDTFKFVMLTEKLDFPEALRVLGRRAGIAVPPPGSGPRSSERESLLTACREASALYRRILIELPEGEPARAYLKRRGVTGETARSLGLGYAPDRWETLREELTRRGHRPEVLLAAGLLVRRESGTGFYDRFRDRITFPITNLSGDVVGFGGRAVGEGEPKYLNSPETLIYNKRENLYGLHHSRHGIKSAGEAIVVEGYLDFVSLYQAGIQNVVATLGTAFAGEQVSLLRRFAPKVVVNYDSDAAGQSATRRSLENLLSSGLGVRVLRLPEGMDPDAFMRERSPEEYRRMIAEAPTCFDFLVESVSRERDMDDPAALAAAVREVVSLLARIPSRIERSRYVGLLSDRLGVEDALLLAEIRDMLIRGKRREPVAESAASRRETGAGVLREVEVRLLRALVEDAECRSRLLPEILPADLEGSRIAPIVARMASLDSEGRSISYGDLSVDLPEKQRELLARVAMRGEPTPESPEAADCLQSLRRARLIRERDSVQKEMEKAADAARLEELMRKKIELSRRIDAMQ